MHRRADQACDLFTVCPFAPLSGCSCNLGSFHAWLPLDAPRVDASNPTDHHFTELRPPARTLLRRLAALPALVSDLYPKRLMVPPLIQLGYFPPDAGAAYRPHLDRWPYETQNKRELTFLLCARKLASNRSPWHRRLRQPKSSGTHWRLPSDTPVLDPRDLKDVNVGWDARRCGGHLRIHPSQQRQPSLPLAPTTVTDVEPLAGRLVIFQAGDCMHEVMPSRHEGRLALTLWVEYDEG